MGEPGAGSWLSAFHPSGTFRRCSRAYVRRAARGSRSRRLRRRRGGSASSLPGGHCPDEHAGAEVSPQHGSNLGAEEGIAAKMALPSATRWAASAGPGRAGRSSRRPRARAARRASRPSARSPACGCARVPPGHLHAEGEDRLTFRAVPTRAWAAPMRPPRRRYSSVSRQNQISSPARASRIAASVPSSVSPPAASSAASSTRHPRPPAPVCPS